MSKFKIKLPQFDMIWNDLLKSSGQKLLTGRSFKRKLLFTCSFRYVVSLGGGLVHLICNMDRYHQFCRTDLQELSIALV